MLRQSNRDPWKNTKAMRFPPFKYLCTRVAGPTLLALLALSVSPAKAASVAAHATSVTQCRDVHLHAAYLAEEKPGQGPGFYVTIENARKAPIAVADPTPLSVHWYAKVGTHWLWRASSGSGGTLVNAFQQHGPLFAETLLGGATAAHPRIVPAGSQYSWAVFSGLTPALSYRPGCQHCTYGNETQYQAVIAYAVLPSGGTAADPALLHCGLRSNPVVMPALVSHISSSR
jgi:hypothetical protein